jgi:hypothetical protein
VIEKYFRKIPPVPTNIYLNQANALEVKHRIEVARLCHFPSIINTLARDEHHQVQAAARENEFWILIGQLQDVLGFEKRERREFARQEVFRIILVLLIFEDDIDVLREVMRNASISTKMISIFINFLHKRGRGRKDQLLLKEAQVILNEKKQRIVKAAEIRKAHKDLTVAENQKTILSKLADNDRVIRKAVHNILLDVHPEQLFPFIQIAINRTGQDSVLNQFIILTEMLTLVMRREGLKKTKIRDLQESMIRDREAGDISVQKYFSNLIQQQRLEILDNCQDDLTNFDNILLLANCHCDSDDTIRNVAANIISIEDVFSLVSDVSTPQHIFRALLDILSEHPDEEIRRRVSATYIEESERLRNRLKELEQSITAYFDIIFNSLGFPQINEYNVSIKSIEQTEKTIDHLAPRFDQNLKEKVDITQSAFAEIKKAIEMEIYNINANIRKEALSDLGHVADMIQHIIDLKDFGREGLRPGVIDDIDPELLTRARTIWQSALGPFLGRIKHLNEMAKIKFSIMARQFDKSETIQNDFIEVMDSFEHAHKKKIDCHLKIGCSQCVKRSCAAERFLLETQFFIEELLDNFLQE